MRGAILNKGESGFTSMKRIFNAIHNTQLHYNWLITDINAYPNNPEFQRLVVQDYIWISGEDLTTMVHKEDFQWIWAVFSGFTLDISEESVLQYGLPFIQDNYEIWNQQPFIQHPLAMTEILACDSSYVTIVSKCDQMVLDLENAFEQALDLKIYLDLIKIRK